MHKLWAPWRIEYIRSEQKEGCIFCDKPNENNDREMLILHRGKHAFVLMNLYPYNNGHLMLAPYSHVDNSNDMSTAERNEIMLLADEAMKILKKTMKADGFNFGANIGRSGGAGIEDHIHYHIVPRWQGDTNFMPVVGHTKVQVQGLQETFDILKPAFDQLI
ncbi:MAG TPA: HIT domain-containing protein [Candidatus Marinimicrobia bacterium]|jgi:ATP adenylyltransferase|nr:HIT domain-containing protein [Candidatus Neomarinimicrobiota bacterium]